MDRTSIPRRLSLAATPMVATAAFLVGLAPAVSTAVPRPQLAAHARPDGVSRARTLASRVLSRELASSFRFRREETVVCHCGGKRGAFWSAVYHEHSLWSSDPPGRLRTSGHVTRRASMMKLPPGLAKYELVRTFAIGGGVDSRSRKDRWSCTDPRPPHSRYSAARLERATLGPLNPVAQLRHGTRVSFRMTALRGRRTIVLTVTQRGPAVYYGLGGRWQASYWIRPGNQQLERLAVDYRGYGGQLVFHEGYDISRYSSPLEVEPPKPCPDGESEPR